MFIADALSRAYINSSSNNNKKFEFNVMTLEVAKSALSPIRYDQLIEETNADDLLTKLSSIITRGQWPSKFNTASSWLQSYYSFRDELSVEDVVVF